MNEKLLSTINIEKKNPLEKLFTRFQEERDLFCELFFQKKLNEVIQSLQNEPLFQDTKRWSNALDLITGADVIKFLVEVRDKTTLGGRDLNGRKRATMLAAAILVGLGHYAYFTGQQLETIVTWRCAATIAYLTTFGKEEARSLLANIGNNGKFKTIVANIRTVISSIRPPTKLPAKKHKTAMV